MEAKMTLGLSMVVKNEATNINGCLRDIHDLFDDIVVFDTGSTDDTVQTLSEKYAARTFTAAVQDDPFVITQARNCSVRENRADWIFILDADESVSRDSLSRMKKMIDGGPDAYFLTWRNDRKGAVFDDYKLALFRKDSGIEFEGLVHSNPQRSARRLGLEVEFLDGVVINHNLSQATPGRQSRKERLERYSSAFPDWWRYKWFLGYTYFKENDFERAVPLLRDTCNSLSHEFPVECLNAHLVLTEINARKGIDEKCVRIMRQATNFMNDVGDDFEVKANRAMTPLINHFEEHIKNRSLAEVRCYEFAY
jgi:glycosyltransferase involved in cell wall biosynthesis